MSLEVSYENNFSGAIFTYHKIMSGTDALTANQKLYDSPHANKLRYCIVDMRDIEQVDISTEQLQLLAKQDLDGALKTTRQKIALVSENGVVEGLSHFYEIYADSPLLEIRFFRSMENARKWINELIAKGEIDF